MWNMQIYTNLMKWLGKVLPGKFVVTGTFLLLMLPLTVNAKDVVVWELDNWFSVEGGGSPDRAVTKIKIENGDTITFVNMGSTNHNAVNEFVEYDGETFFEGDLFSENTLRPGAQFTTDHQLA